MTITHVRRTALLAALLLTVAWPAARAAEPPAKVPGVVIDHVPAASGLYVGSPSIAILPGGDYVASHDLFGPKSAEMQRATSRVFRSSDRGLTWRQVSTIEGQFWSTLFVHRGALYILGTDRHHGNAIIRRSTDGGSTWTTPADGSTGLLRDNGEYHCGPMPVLEHAGRLWRAIEWRNPPVAWGINYRAGVLSVPVDADLLDASAWTCTEFLPSDRSWNDGDMGAWLEGNAVVAPDGQVVDVLRVQTRSPEEKAAIVRISPDGKRASFDPATGFVPFPGGAKKFTIRFDPQSKLYWTLASIVHERHWANNPGGIRNTLALSSSPNLTEWTVRCIVLYHPDVAKHGFQYVDWLFEGDDIVAACRTAYDDGQGGAHNAHDANFLTFHRVAGFRSLTMADSVPITELPSQRFEVGDLAITGRGFELAKLDEGGQAYSNRQYVWENVPQRLRGVPFTRTAGGERAEIRVKALRDTTLVAVTGRGKSAPDWPGWQCSDETFSYTDGGHTQMAILTRALAAGEEVNVPQENWTGGLVLAGP